MEEGNSNSQLHEEWLTSKLNYSSIKQVKVCVAKAIGTMDFIHVDEWVKVFNRKMGKNVYRHCCCHGVYIG